MALTTHERLIATRLLKARTPSHTVHELMGIDPRTLRDLIEELGLQEDSRTPMPRAHASSTIRRHAKQLLTSNLPTNLNLLYAPDDAETMLLLREVAQHVQDLTPEE